MSRQLLLDYGQVISTAQDRADVHALAALAGLEPAEFDRRYWAARPAYDAGGAAADYWAELLGHPPAAGLLAELVERDVRSWLRIDPAVPPVLAELRAAGVAVSLLSNAPRELAAALVGHPVLHGFRRLLFSAELALVKPDPRIFAEVTGQLGVPPSQIVFVDDRADNVAAAAAAGLHAVHYDGDPDSLRRLPLHP